MKEFDAFIQPNISLLIPIFKVSRDIEIFDGTSDNYRIVIDFKLKAKKRNNKFTAYKA